MAADEKMKEEIKSDLYQHINEVGLKKTVVPHWILSLYGAGW